MDTIKILIADDDSASKYVLKSLLQKEGYDTVFVMDGTSALEMIKKDQDIRVALLEIDLAGYGGLELCQRIRKLDTIRDRYTYLILQSSKEDQLDIEWGYKAGADEYLVKPIKPIDFVQRIKVAYRIVKYEMERAEKSSELWVYAVELEKLVEERAAQLVHADRMVTLGTMAAGVAHEINNPASFIAGNAQTIERAWNGLISIIDEQGFQSKDEHYTMIREEVPHMIAGIRKGVERITKIVSGLKSFARKNPFEKKAIALQTVIQNAIVFCAAIAKNIDVKYSMPDEPVVVNGDTTQLEQVLINLLTNAFDALQQCEGPRVDIQLECTMQCARIAVIDNGQGIPHTIIDNIFDPFFSTKGKTNGTGLGLSISKGIIEEHNGTIQVSNNDTSGARFIIELPLMSESVHGALKKS